MGSITGDDCDATLGTPIIPTIEGSTVTCTPAIGLLLQRAVDSVRHDHLRPREASFIRVGMSEFAPAAAQGM